MPRPKKIVDDLYHVCLELMGVEYVGKGDSLQAAVENMDKPKAYINRGVFVMRHGDKVITKILAPMVMKRMFMGSKVAQMLALKMYVNALK